MEVADREESSTRIVSRMTSLLGSKVLKLKEHAVSPFTEFFLFFISRLCLKEEQRNNKPGANFC